MKTSVEEFTAGYYGLCAVEGMLSAGAAHLAITPLDALKVKMQVNPVKYHGILSGFSTLCREEGASALWRGWSCKLFGYGIQAVKIQVQAQKNFAKGSLMDFQSSMLMRDFMDSTRVCFLFGVVTCHLIYKSIIQRKKEDCSKAQQLAVTCIGGYAAGAVGTVISNPADNIDSSLYNKKAVTIVQAVKKIGVANLFTRSLPVRIATVGPVVALQWFFYDSIKVLNGLPTSGGLRRHLNAAKA